VAIYFKDHLFYGGSFVSLPFDLGAERLTGPRFVEEQRKQHQRPYHERVSRRRGQVEVLRVQRCHVL
jgi:hypothetical protein